MKQVALVCSLGLLAAGCGPEIGDESSAAFSDSEIIREPRPELRPASFAAVGTEAAIEVSWVGRCWSEFFEEEYDCLEQAFEVSASCQNGGCEPIEPTIIGARGEIRVRMLSAGRHRIAVDFTNLATGEVQRKSTTVLAMEPDSVFIECYTDDDVRCDEADIVVGDSIRTRHYATEGTELVSPTDIFLYSTQRANESAGGYASWDALEGPLFIIISRGEARADYRVIPRQIRGW